MEGSYTHIGEAVNSPRIHGIIDDLSEFMKNQGLEHAKSIIYFEAYKELEKKRDTGFFLQEIILRKTTHTSLLMYMKRKSETQLNWIEKNTKPNKLKELIKLHKAVSVTYSRFDSREPL
ncbi:hypothetical protein [Flammeovirga pacifica]|uniref:Uncharacterized protein n=1 Tax=Flammeovirga pacifica TaxID=915059 RepID=A0A1S1Z570_FLAPC|nr:hypothetical protein [Flammeovirga pacifica]OHX68381.1 hypothetical protein NH26_19515 [Flammeovirga pacifica]